MFTSIFMIVKRNHINLSTVKFGIFDIHTDMRVSLVSRNEKYTQRGPIFSFDVHNIYPPI